MDAISGLPTPSASGPRPEDAAKLREVANEFEGLLLHMLLKSMRDTVPESTLFGDSNELEMYEGLRDEHLAQAMSKRSGLGLADAIERQLGGQPDAMQQLRTALQGAKDQGARQRVVGAGAALPPREEP